MLFSACMLLAALIMPGTSISRPELLPPVQLLPSPSRMFVFFHVRKAGGSAMRRYIALAASALNISFFVPWEGKIPGNLLPASLPILQQGHNYHLDYALGHPRAKELAVVAGPFHWDVFGQLQLLREGRNGTWAGRGKATSTYAQIRHVASSASCLVLYREPVARWQSCYEEYFRHRVPATLGRPVEQLPESLLHTLLLNYTDGQFGCTNELARWLSPDSGWGDQRVNQGQLSRAAVQEVKRRLGTCVVGNMVSREAETWRVLDHFFPWLKAASTQCAMPGHSAGCEGRHSTHRPSTELPVRTLTALHDCHRDASISGRRHACGRSSASTASWTSSCTRLRSIAFSCSWTTCRRSLDTRTRARLSPATTAARHLQHTAPPLPFRTAPAPLRCRGAGDELSRLRASANI